MIAGLESYRIGVLSGGFSDEREISFRSGRNVHAALVRLGYDARLIDPAMEPVLGGVCDIAFNVLHGFFGEDGSIQSLLEAYGIPYTGSGPTASMLSMNKILTKQVLIQEGLPTPPYVVITADTYTTIPIPFPLPWIIKPVAVGSSVGIEICDTEVDYTRHGYELTKRYGACLVEALITGQEITVGVLDDRDDLMALPILELIPKNRFYDYEAKYTPNMTDFILPAMLSDSMTDRCHDLAKTMHQIMGCRGVSRTDMIVSPDFGPMILELNSIPGMTDTSDLPAQARHAGITFDDLVERILASAL